MKEIDMLAMARTNGFRLGNAQDRQGGTGCTVLVFPESAPCAVDVRGGGPASRESELLSPMAAASGIHAILLSGGSAFGLNASTGVMQYLEEQHIGFDTRICKVPLVVESCIYDLGCGDNVRPDAAMGYADLGNGLPYELVVDPLGGINTLWPLFGIANQMLAGMALMLCAVVLFKMKRQRYAWVALVPTAWLLICTLTAGWQKAFSPDNKVGFLAIANKFQAMIDSGKIPAQYTESQLSQLVFNNRLDAGLTIFFMVVVVVLALYSLKTALAALKEDKPTAKETPYEPMPENLEEIVTQAKGAH